MNDSTYKSFLASLVESDEGRQHILSRAVDAEEADEGGIFDWLAGLVDDVKLRRVVERHRDDETRHAELFRACLERLGLQKVEVPDELKVVPRIAAMVYADKSAGVPGVGFDGVGVYAVLHAIELRGVNQFPLIAEAFDAVDAETAATYRRVAKDECGHVKHCERLGRYLATDASEWYDLVLRIRPLEETAFSAVRRDDIEYCIQHHWVDATFREAANSEI